MRKGFLSVLGISLVSGALAHGQTESLPPTPHEGRSALKATSAPKAPASAPASTYRGTYQATAADADAPPAHIAGTHCGDGCCDCCCTGLRPWIAAEYLLWWIKDGPLNTPLATSTAGVTPGAPPGALGQPGTQVLFGGDIDYTDFAGLRISAGVPISDLLSLEGSFFLLERRSVNFSLNSDATGNPFIARPVFNEQFGIEDVYATSNPGFGGRGIWSGGIAIASHTRLQGYELNLAANLCDSCDLRVDLIGGYRALDLNEDLSIQENITAVSAGTLSYVGNFINPGDQLVEFERFHASNKFYGGQLGLRVEREWELPEKDFFGRGKPPARVSLGAYAKVALGWVQTIAELEGHATHITPAGTTTVPGSVLVQTTNAGRHFRSDFSVVPEAGVNVGYRLSNHLKATVGYNFLYWTRVARPGNLIDRTVNPALAPTDQLYGNGLGTNRPAFTWHESDFWAQGLTVGLLFSF